MNDVIERMRAATEYYWKPESYRITDTDARAIVAAFDALTAECAAMHRASNELATRLRRERDNERAAIVAWLRRHADGELSANYHVQGACRSLANAIEAGEHATL